MGSRPKFTPDLEEVERLASQGLTQKQICVALGICNATLHNHKNKNKEFAAALERGQCRGIETVTNYLMQQAKGGNVAATIFYLKNRDRDNWRDKWKEDEEDTGSTVNINMIGVDKAKD